MTRLALVLPLLGAAACSGGATAPGLGAGPVAGDRRATSQGVIVEGATRPTPDNPDGDVLVTDDGDAFACNDGWIFDC